MDRVVPDGVRVVSAARRTAAVVALAAAMVGMPGTAGACPVCFGASDSPLAAGMNAGILVLLGVTSVVLGAIAVVGRRVARAARTAASAHPTDRASEAC